MRKEQKIQELSKTIYISDLNFDANLADGYKNGKADQFEEDLVAAQKLFQWADHVIGKEILCLISL